MDFIREPESNFVRHYVLAYETTVRLRREPTLTSVLELDTWRGQPADSETVERMRRVVLLDTDMNASLRVQADLIRGDMRMLHTLLKLFSLHKVPQVMKTTRTEENRMMNPEREQQASLILGYDFFGNTPHITITD